MNVSRRKFLKTSTICACSIPLIGLADEKLPRKYHKITRGWSISCRSVTNWNDFNIYSKVGLSKGKDFCLGEVDTENEYILRGDNNYIYVNKDRYYEIKNYKGEFKDKGCHVYEVEFDIVKYLGPTPTERIIIISGYDYCIYAIGRDYYKEVERDFVPFGIRKVWILDRQEVFRPLTKDMHSQVKYSDFNRKTYQEYLESYNVKLKKLGLI